MEAEEVYNEESNFYYFRRVSLFLCFYFLTAAGIINRNPTAGSRSTTAFYNSPSFAGCIFIVIFVIFFYNDFMQRKKIIIALGFAAVMFFCYLCTPIHDPGDNDNHNDDEEWNIALKSSISDVQPMTGIVFWSDAHHDKAAIIQLEFSYMRYNQIVENRGQYNWSPVENLLKAVAKRKHQAVLRFWDTYPGEATGVPDYIKNDSDYNETKGISEGEVTYFPDWSFKGLEDFILDFYSKFAERYDKDPRLAFLQVGFGLWAEYHIYDGPMILGKTFPSRAFQKRFIERLAARFHELHWSISIDAADEETTPFAGNPALLDIPFGLFDDSFLNKDHHKYNTSCFAFFGGNRFQRSPIGGELSYYSQYDQEHALDKNGPYGISFEELSKKFHVSYMIGNDQPDYQPLSRIKEAGMNIGYKFRIKSFKASAAASKIGVENFGIAPLYYDAYVTVNGVHATESLKLLLPGQTKEYTVAAGGRTPILTIACDRLVPGQTIQFAADLEAH